MSRLEKTTIVCDQEVVDAVSAVFTARDEDRGHLCTVIVPRETWDDMGSPVVVTVTVIPGDTLNAEDVA